MSDRKWWQFGSGPVGGRPREERPDEHLSRTAIRALYRIILTALIGIIALSIVGAAFNSGLIGESIEGALFGAADEALSVLGNIASAAVGGLVGWLTRDLVVRDSRTGQETMVPEGEAFEVDGEDH